MEVPNPKQWLSENKDKTINDYFIHIKSYPKDQINIKSISPNEVRYSENSKKITRNLMPQTEQSSNLTNNAILTICMCVIGGISYFLPWFSVRAYMGTFGGYGMSESGYTLSSAINLFGSVYSEIPIVILKAFYFIPVIHVITFIAILVKNNGVRYFSIFLQLLLTGSLIGLLIYGFTATNTLQLFDFTDYGLYLTASVWLVLGYTMIANK